MVFGGLILSFKIEIAVSDLPWVCFDESGFYSSFLDLRFCLHITSAEQPRTSPALPATLAEKSCPRLFTIHHKTYAKEFFCSAVNMNTILACFGHRDRVPVKDLSSSKQYSTQLIENANLPYDEKKATFTVLVTGMGVSGINSIMIRKDFPSYYISNLLQYRHTPNTRGTRRAVTTPKTTILLISSPNYFPPI
jgi:hypothetical protein